MKTSDLSALVLCLAGMLALLFCEVPALRLAGKHDRDAGQNELVKALNLGELVDWLADLK